MRGALLARRLAAARTATHCAAAAAAAPCPLWPSPATAVSSRRLQPQLCPTWPSAAARPRPASTIAPAAAKQQPGGAAAAGPKPAGKGEGGQSSAQAARDETQEDGFLDDAEEGGEQELLDVAEGDEEGEEEGEEEGYDEDEDEDEDEEGGSGGDYASLLEPDDAPREVATGGTTWGEAVLRATRAVLAQPALQGLELYLFRAIPSSRKVDIRLDKLDDVYGSPSIDDIERFQRGLFGALERELGAEAAGEISFEVSSPGAERIVRVPDELSRFAGLPLKVEYRAAAGGAADATSAVLVLQEVDEAGGTTVWSMANVRANAPTKGRALSKKVLAARTAIPLADILRVRIHVDF